jgi:transposase
MLHSLHKHGKSINEISKITGLNKRTVMKRLKEKTLGSKKTPRPSKLDKFKPYIDRRVKDMLPRRISSTVVLSEINDMGYEGRIRILKEYISGIFNNYSHANDEPLVRFETAPGYQIQVDWTTVRNGRDPIHCFLSVLGYSRYAFIYFVDNLKLGTFIDCHLKAFDYYGGITKTILYDNLKSVMIKRNAYGGGLHKFNPSFLDFAKSMGFIPRTCMPYRAKTKGKVERFARFVKENFYYPLKAKLKNSGIDLTAELLNTYSFSWLETVNRRIHGTTGKRPLDMFIEEKNYLMPAIPYTPIYEIPEISIEKSSLSSYGFLTEGV